MQKEFRSGAERGGGQLPTDQASVKSDGDIEEPVLKSILNKIRQESGIATEIPVDRLVDLSMLREARAELRNDNGRQRETERQKEKRLDDRETGDGETRGDRIGIRLITI